MIYIKEVKIKNFKSIEDRAISLNQGLNIVVGANNAGKTNIIEALDLVIGDVYLPRFEPSTDHFFNGDESREITIEILLRGPEVSNLIQDISGEEVSVRYRFVDQKGIFEVRRNDGWTSDPRYPFKDWWGFEKQLFFLRVKSLRNIMEIAPIRWKSPLKYFKDAIIRQASREKLNEVILAVEDAKNKLSTIDEVNHIVSDLLIITKEQTGIKNISLSPSPTKYSDLLNEMKIFVDDGYLSEVARKGLGTQNSIIIALFRVMAKYIREQEHKVIIYGIDEPEIGLHPHAQRHLLKSLEKLAEFSQVLITTHSGNLVDIYKIENIIRANRNDGKTVTYQAELSSEQKKILEIHGENIQELFFCQRALIVEGKTESGFFGEASKKVVERMTQDDGQKVENNCSFDINSVSVVNGQGDMVWHFVKLVKVFNIPFLLLVDSDKISEPSAYNTFIGKAKEAGLVDQEKSDELSKLANYDDRQSAMKNLGILVCHTFETSLCETASEEILRKIIQAVNFVKQNWGYTIGINDFASVADLVTLRNEVVQYLKDNKKKRVGHAIAHALQLNEYPSEYVEIIKQISKLGL